MARSRKLPDIPELRGRWSGHSADREHAVCLGIGCWVRMDASACPVNMASNSGCACKLNA